MGIDTLAILDAHLSISEIVEAIERSEHATDATWRYAGGSSRYILVDLAWKNQPISLNVFLEGYCCEDYEEVHQRPMADGYAPLTLVTHEWHGSRSEVLEQITRSYGGWFLSNDSSATWETIAKS